MSNKTIQHKRSSVKGNTPSTAQVAVGELAINFADKSIYTQDGGSNIIELARDVFKTTTQPASPAGGDIWYNDSDGFVNVYDSNQSAWIPIVYNGAAVTTGNTSSSVGFGGGSGTSGDPYTYSANTSATAGSSNVYVDTVTVTGLTPGQVVEITDANASTNGGRFSVSNNTVASNGVLTFVVTFTDLPASAGGTNYTANYQIGSNSSYVDVTASIVSQFPQSVNAPTKAETAASTSWTAANDTITASNCYEVSTDNSTFSTSVNVNTGDTLYVRWTGAAGSGLCIDDSHGDTITGTLTSSNSTTQVDTLVVDKTPDAFTWSDDSGNALSDVVTSNQITVSGINSYAYVYYDSSDAGDPEYSKNGGTFANLPNSLDSARTAGVYLLDGDDLQIRHTTSASSGVNVGTRVHIGGTSDTYDSKTVTAAASVVTPTIVAPTSGSTGISITPNIISSTYSVSSGAGTHASSDWEIYDGPDPATDNLLLSSLTDTSSLESISPLLRLSYNTTYYVRVKHRSNDPIESAWSSISSFTTVSGLSANASTYAYDEADGVKVRSIYLDRDDIAVGDKVIIFLSGKSKGAHGDITAITQADFNGSAMTELATVNFDNSAGDYFGAVYIYTATSALSTLGATGTINDTAGNIKLDFTSQNSTRRMLVSSYVISASANYVETLKDAAASNGTSLTHSSAGNNSYVLSATFHAENGGTVGASNYTDLSAVDIDQVIDGGFIAGYSIAAQLFSGSKYYATTGGSITNTVNNMQNGDGFVSVLFN